MLWLLFEAVLAALKQTVGLGKNTPQTGREGAEFSWQLLTATAPALPSQASAHRRSPRPGQRRTLQLGGGAGEGGGSSAHLEGVYGSFN